MLVEPVVEHGVVAWIARRSRTTWSKQTNRDVRMRKGQGVPMVRLLTLPYHLGRERVGMGKGPDRFIEAGVVERARGRDLAVEVEETTRTEDFEHETGATFAVLRSHTENVGRALDEGAFPLTLGGNCSTTIATVAALGNADQLGVVWFDAHGDANTPETTTSGFFDGMPLAILAGWCWRSLAASVPGFEPLPETNLLLAAARALDDDERRLLDDSDVAVVPAESMRTPEHLHGSFLTALDALAARVQWIYVHIDLDAMDPTDGRANEFAASGGPSLQALTACLDHIAGRGQVVAASLTSYNPDCDSNGQALRSGLQLFDHLLPPAAG